MQLRRVVGKAGENGTLNAYKGAPHGIPTMHAEQVNADLLAFANSWRSTVRGLTSGARVG